jgi:hypothetical protein
MQEWEPIVDCGIRIADWKIRDPRLQSSASHLSFDSLMIKSVR